MASDRGTEQDGGSAGDAFARYRAAAAETRQPARPTLPTAAALVCAAAVVVGTFGPWLHRRRGLGRPVETLDGLAYDGALALAGAGLAIVALLAVLARPRLTVAAWAGVAGLALAAVVGAADWLVLDTAGPGFVRETRGASHEIGWGLWLVVLAAVLGTACGIVVVRRLD